MDKNFYWWSAIIVTTFLLIVIIVLNAAVEVKKLEDCKQARIRPFPQQFFSWNGIQELGAKGQYQPSCL